MLALAAILLVIAECVGSIPVTPENITVTFLTSTSVKVAWQTSTDSTTPVEKYDVTYKPTNARIVAIVAGNSEEVTLTHLIPDTQYSLSVVAFYAGKKYRSRSIAFRTLEPPQTWSQEANVPDTGQTASTLTTGIVITNDYRNSSTTAVRTLPTVRGVEVGIVVVVLIVWAGAIALFFNRWGKIRMLLPYQPDYKQEQLKVPGTGLHLGSSCNGQHSHQHFHPHYPDEPSIALAERCTRNRINSAIFVSSEGRGFDSIEFLRRHGSQSVLCRKAKSAENINDSERKRSFSVNREWKTEDSDGGACNNSAKEIIEVAECHKSESSTTNLVNVNVLSKPSLPTLSVSGPSPPHENDLL